MRTMPFPALAFFILAVSGLSAADLTTRDGQVFHNFKVIGHDEGSITIMDSDGGQKIPLSNLPADLQKQYGYDPAKADAVMKAQAEEDQQQRKAIAAAQLAAQQQAAVAPSTVAPAQLSSQRLSVFASAFVKHLLVMRNGSPQDPDLRSFAPVKYWAFYYSASWCPPCRRFSPSLVSFYNQFKPKHPDFELVLVGDDRTEDAMLAYLKNDAMPWPAVKFDDLHDDSLGVQQYCGKGIPCLVLVDADGKVLSDTYRHGQYEGPEVVVDDIKKMVP